MLDEAWLECMGQLCVTVRGKGTSPWSEVPPGWWRKSKSGPHLISLCPKEKVCAKTQLTETTTHRKGFAAWASPGQSPAETAMDRSLTDPQPHNATFQMSGTQCRVTQPGEKSWVQVEKGSQEKPILRLAQMLCFSGRHQSSCYKGVWQTKEEDALKQVDNGRPQPMPGGKDI